MADMKSKIKKLLQEHGSMTARDIAKELGCSSSEVNRFIYYCDEFEKDDSYAPLWSIKNSRGKRKATESDPVMLKLQNRKGAKKFTQKDFDELAAWDESEAYIDKEDYVTNSGKIIECDSPEEVMLLEYLEENGLVKDVGGQALRIKYDTAFRVGCNYQPDIVALTHDNHIAVFEVKPLIAMSNHTNIEKYRFLAKYCEERGFMYVMLDPNMEYTSFEELRDMEVCRELLEMFEEFNAKPHTSRRPYKHFDNHDVEKWYEKYGDGWTKEDFKIHVHSLIIYYDWYNVFDKGFNAFSRPVKQVRNDDGTYSVIEYI